MAAEFGDSRALKAASIKAENKNKSILSNDEIKALEESGLFALYDSIKSVSVPDGLGAINIHTGSSAL